MKKKRLSTEDGSEFTVYYLGSDGKEVSLEKGNPVGHLGTHDITLGYDPWSGHTEIQPFKTNMIMAPAVKEIIIDDTIEKDLVEEPANGRIYKVKSLGGVIARLKETHVGDKNLNPDTIYARMDLHGTEFLVAVEDLRKATEFEVEKYLEKKLTNR